VQTKERHPDVAAISKKRWKAKNADKYQDHPAWSKGS